MNPASPAGFSFIRQLKCGFGQECGSIQTNNYPLSSTRVQARHRPPRGGNQRYGHQIGPVQATAERAGDPHRSEPALHQSSFIHLSRETRDIAGGDIGAGVPQTLAQPVDIPARGQVLAGEGVPQITQVIPLRVRDAGRGQPSAQDVIRLRAADRLVGIRVNDPEVSSAIHAQRQPDGRTGC